MFSPADIELIMNRVRGFTPPLRSATYVTLIGLLAATGLRIGEAIKLDRGDVDWSSGVLLIRESKFGKSRLVPVTDTTLQALADYAVLRDRAAAPAPGAAAELLHLPHPAPVVLRRGLGGVPQCHRRQRDRRRRAAAAPAARPPPHLRRRDPAGLVSIR